MQGEKRREQLLQILRSSGSPVAGRVLSDTLQVSRQVIVQDIALLRANGSRIFSTNRGYYLVEQETAAKPLSRVFKVRHSEEEVEEELNMIVDLGGRVEDVFVYHKVYNVVRATLHLYSRWDVQNYMDNIRAGQSSLLMRVTSGYHYHTVSADSEAVLDRIQNALQKRGFLAPLRDYEPVDFWQKAQ